jgi:hypothetical protein
MDLPNGLGDGLVGAGWCGGAGLVWWWWVGVVVGWCGGAGLVWMWCVVDTARRQVNFSSKEVGLFVLHFGIQ